jgi:hypothetical protein
VSGLTAASLLDAWDRGQALAYDERANLLLATAHPQTTAEGWSQMPLGAREAQLLALRGRLFGRTLEGLSRCPGCGERVETSLDLAAILGEAVDNPPELEHRADGIRVRFRLPTSADLAALSGASSTEDAVLALLGRCVLEAEDQGRRVGVAELPAPYRQALAEHMGDCDPLADIELDLRCPACGHTWQQPLDSAVFLWEEVGRHAVRLLREVDTLAKVYRWSEREILDLSPQRRRAYIELALS